ncbi:sensor histidine kinase [Aliiglaciecola sp. CAU 1673]|uniref:sensor histidine kinase n=1 Tax=Aliiglaciecola sp. CAU 1673 TaxID=3032595 RepID=UPI0023DADC86|nr:sensor histidine kinase [Aliiglaciecola sp. CAU 1673]MDF2179486.1 sensor histidine kinase [Aliiglaciecola sp. CAU 1673]
MLTWSLVGGSSIYFMLDMSGLASWQVPVAALLYIAYLVAFLTSTSERKFVHDDAVRMLSLVIMFFIVLALYFVVPLTYNAILMTIWSAMLPHFMPIRRALWLSPLWSLPLALVFMFYWRQDYILLTGLLYWSFNVFALITMNTTIKERDAKEAANRLNRELLATQALLAEAGKQAERTRIARNIHDLLGHHLTALTINLQVAARKTDGEAQQLVQRCHAIASLLLGDVREAVSEIREKSAIDLRKALQNLTSEVPRLQVDMQYEAEVDDMEQAQAILMCVKESLTNSLKHGQADHFALSLHNEGDKLVLWMQDNGKSQPAFCAGNGLKGIRERVEAIGGKVQFNADAQGFQTQISLPQVAA